MKIDNVFTFVSHLEWNYVDKTMADISGSQVISVSQLVQVAEEESKKLRTALQEIQSSSSDKMKIGKLQHDIIQLEIQSRIRDHECDKVKQKNVNLEAENLKVNTLIK
jgi:hypothetical protein